MKIQWLSLPVVALLLSACGRLEQLPYLPPQTPETWLQIQPVAQVHLAGRTFLLVQPSTSAIVYLLGLITLAAGLFILRRQNHHLSRRWWAVALFLWGLGALLAGTSYEAFSYQIKCAGRAACLWTSGWEIAYLLLSVASINAMLVAQAYACAAGKLRAALTGYAAANLTLYSAAVLAGVLLPSRFLISFEMLILACAPTIVLFLALNGWRYARLKQPKDLALLAIWLWLVVTIAAYFLYYLSGLTQRLWARGAWFSENDVLHIGLILWMAGIAFVAARWIKDEPRPPIGG